MTDVCCVLGPRKWFDELRDELDPSGPELCRMSSLDDPVSCMGRADVVVVCPPDEEAPRQMNETLRRLAQPEFGDPLRLVAVPVDDEIDRVVAFELGADDVVAHPVSFREVGLRVRALLRRQKPAARRPAQTHFGRLEIDHEARDVRIDGKRAGLTLAEFRIVSALAAAPGVVVQRDDLLVAARGASNVGLRSVDTHIKRIRQKLALPNLIRTVRGVGYRLIPPGDRPADRPASADADAAATVQVRP